MGVRRPFILFYTLSGAAGLVYEVTWTRLLTLELGHTVAAASTVLAAFMGGLAIGAWAAGRLRARPAAVSLRLYAALELLVAIAALLLPVLLHASAPALAWAYADGTTPTRFALLRVAISLVLVGIPAAAMGATFPISVGALMTSAPDAGLLYAANTAGAGGGAILAGFWLIPALGLRGTTWVGVALNVAAASGAFWLASQLATPNAKTAKSAEDESPNSSLRPLRPLRSSQPAASNAKSANTAKQQTPKPSLRPSRPLRSNVLAARPGLACAAAAISGFSALVYEVAWTRLLALVIGPTTYAFATMAASFISGLAIGSAIGTRIARRTNRPALWLAMALTAGAVAAVVSAWYTANTMPLSVAAQVADPAADFSRIVWAQAFSVGVLLLPMTLALGAAFPLALAVADPATVTSSAAYDVARVYTANTLGAILGALAAGFVLIPALGLRGSIRAGAVAAALAGVACLYLSIEARTSDARSSFRLSGFRAHPAATIAAVAALAAIWFVPSWDRALLASGAYKYAPYLGANDLETVLRAGRLVYYKEGPTGTVSVKDLGGIRSLAIDGKVDASSAGDMLTQRLLGLLPVLIHGSAEDVAIIGLGSGVTVGSALAPGTARRTDVIEISPEVVEASHFFDRENGGALSRPGVRLIVGDGRSHLLFTPRRYDVIVSEPSNPWMAGVASLFTREFFEAAKARLKPNGILCQWAHTYDISTDDLRSIVRTFDSVFPEGTLWLVGGGDLLLIGSKDGPIAPRLAAVESGTQKDAVTSALGDVGIAKGTAPFALFSLYAGGPEDMRRFAGDAIVQTDDRTALEYSAPRGIYGRTREDNAAAIRSLHIERPPAVEAAFTRATDADWTSRGTMDLRAQAFVFAYEAFHQAVALNSRNPAALAGLSDAAGGASRLQDERDWLKTIAARDPDNAAVRVELSRVLAVTGDANGAIQMASDALELAPNDARAAEQLASVLADAGDTQRLGPYAQALTARFPDRVDPRYYVATALFMSGRTEDAAAAARQVVDHHPDHARAQGLLGAACAALGRRECAQAAFDASIRDNPRDPSGYVNAGTFNLQVGKPAAAVSYFASALAIDPSSGAARTGLAQARSLLEQR